MAINVFMTAKLIKKWERRKRGVEKSAAWGGNVAAGADGVCVNR